MQQPYGPAGKRLAGSLSVTWKRPGRRRGAGAADRDGDLAHEATGPAHADPRFGQRDVERRARAAEVERVGVVRDPPHLVVGEHGAVDAQPAALVAHPDDAERARLAERGGGAQARDRPAVGTVVGEDVLAHAREDVSAAGRQLAGLVRNRRRRCRRRLHADLGLGARAERGGEEREHESEPSHAMDGGGSRGRDRCEPSSARSS